jgi:hypothetical protein
MLATLLLVGSLPLYVARLQMVLQVDGDIVHEMQVIDALQIDTDQGLAVLSSTFDTHRKVESQITAQVEAIRQAFFRTHPNAEHDLENTVVPMPEGLTASLSFHSNAELECLLQAASSSSPHCQAWLKARYAASELSRADIVVALDLRGTPSFKEWIRELISQYPESSSERQKLIGTYMRMSYSEVPWPDRFLLDVYAQGNAQTKFDILRCVKPDVRHVFLLGAPDAQPNPK